MSNRNKLTHELELAFRQTFRRMKKELNAVLGETTNRSEFIFLQQLYTRGPLKVSALSAEFEVSASHITHVTDRLVQKNWVRRQRSQKDKRVVELQITEEGNQAFLQMEEKQNEYFRRKFDPLSDQEIKILLNLIQKLNA
ncbi:MarR family winged helix-turn-helix transcriptional regulator [Paludifilum halophilum]|uniref:MarR family winged helix-turn-helix transcriptional regulator n=1 Tax=Paludifilum halophilum TaxID=1642702 RepID=UPI00146E5099|nr:MarR family transcriptional regulator [Paludifilum halophilum]